MVELIDRIEISETYDMHGESVLEVTISYKFSLKILNYEPQKINRAA